MRKIKFLGQSIGLEWFLLSVIVVTGIFLRIEAHKHLTAISPDGIAYVYGSLQVLQENGQFERRGPLFQSLLLISYMIFGVSFQSSVLIPQLFGSVIPILLFLLGKRFFDSETSLLAALLATLNPMLTNLSSWVLRETLSATLILGLILVTHYTIKIRSTKKSLFLTVFPGIISGLIILTREEMLFIIPPAYVAYVLFMEKKRKIFLARAGIFLLATLLVMSPWLMYSLTHFGDPFYSYNYYIDPKYVSATSGEQSTGAIKAPIFLTVLGAFFFGLWKMATELPAVFSFLGLAFIPFGIISTFKKRDLWLIYLVTGLDLALVSFFASMPWYFNVPTRTYDWSDPTRFFFSAAIAFNIVIAFGIRRLFPFLTELRSKAVLAKQRKQSNNRRKRKRTLLRHRYPKVSSLWIFTIIGILVLGIAAYLPPYVFTFEDFDTRSTMPFIETAKFLNSTGGIDGVLTMYPDLLARYYRGPIYKLPESGGFEHLREEALKKGAKYILIESTSVTSPELIRLYYKSVYPTSWWTQIPSEFVLVQEKKRSYGLFLIQTELWFKAAIFGTTQWESHVQWEHTISLIGGSTELFDDTTIISSVDLSEFNVVIFTDFLRPLNDTERASIESAIRNGLTVIISGLSPFHLAGGTTNLTKISSWFGATQFNEAPKQERWKTKFTENATQIVEELVLDREYVFYTTSDWSTPTGAVTHRESIVYAYRIDDQVPTIFSHNFGSGTSIFIGPRFGFESSDATIFRTFLQSLIINYISKG